MKGRSFYFFLWLFILTAGIRLPCLKAQEHPPRVERSTEKVIIGGKVYYIHIVEKGQTLYSISKAYGVPEKVISRENPVLVTGLQPGMVLKIPYVPPGEKVTETSPSSPEQEGSYVLHTMQEGETLFSLSRQYHVTVEEILKANPGLRPEDIPLGRQIRIPRKRVLPEKLEFTQEPQQKGIVHVVQPGETLFSIARSYGLTVRDLKKYNKGLRNRIRPGDRILIPVQPAAPTAGKERNYELPSDTTSPAVQVATYETPCDSLLPATAEKRTWRIAVLLPLYLKENAQRSYIDSSRIDPVTGKRIRKIIRRDPNWIYPPTQALLPFYQGIVVALDTLGHTGLQAQVTIYDTEKDLSVVDSLIRSGILDSADLVIGPVYPSLLSLVADYTRKKQIPLVSPLSRKDDFLHFNPFAFQCRPSRDMEDRYVASYLAGHTDKNIVIIHADDSLSRQRYEKAKNYIVQYLPSFLHPDDLIVREVMVPHVIAPHDTMNNIRLSLDKYRDNLVWVLSDEEGFVSEVVSRLNTHSDLYPIRLVGNSTWRYFRNLELEFFFKMNLHLFTPGRVDMDRPKVRQIIRLYRKHFSTDPPEMSFAWYGYDETVFFLTLLQKRGRSFLQCPGDHTTPLAVRTFRFERTGWFSGFMNTHMELLEYQRDYSIRKVPFVLPEIHERP